MGEHFDVDAFCADNALDNEATTQLKNLDPEMQKEVLGRGPLTDARNPSAVLLSRIRKLRDGPNRSRRSTALSDGERKDLEHKVKRFIEDNDLDERASACLRESDDEILKELFARGPLTGARNPSAMVLSRIRSIKDDIADGRVGKSQRRDYDDDKGKGKGKGDDWWWYMPPWAWWGGKGPWDSWGKGDWGKGKGEGDWGKGKGAWDDGKGKGGDGKGRPGPY